MNKQWDRFEYRLFRENDSISIRKIYYLEVKLLNTISLNKNIILEC